MRSRVHLSAVALVGCTVAALHLPSAAQLHVSNRVDDSGTVVSVPVVPMRWRALERGRGVSGEVDGQLDVALRLNLTPWITRDVRLYLVLERAVTPGAIITANWRASGLLLSGTVQSGGRVLLYQGRVTEPVMHEKLHFTLTTDGTRLSGTEAVQFHVEAESR